MLFFVTVGHIQSKINGEDYLLIETRAGETINGELHLTAPTKQGLYDVIGYAVCNPASDINDILMNIVETGITFKMEVV